MGFFGKLFGGGSARPGAPGPPDSDRSPEYEEHLEKHFGLRPEGSGWTFRGGPVHSNFVDLTSDPASCWALLNRIKEGGEVAFDRVCVVLGKPVMLVCNTDPPVCIVSGLNPDGVAALVSAATGASHDKVRIYHDTLMLTL